MEKWQARPKGKISEAQRDREGCLVWAFVLGVVAVAALAWGLAQRAEVVQEQQPGPAQSLGSE
jgi:hypothetical protein